jgi:hypothetical protein
VDTDLDTRLCAELCQRDRARRLFASQEPPWYAAPVLGMGDTPRSAVGRVAIAAILASAGCGPRDQAAEPCDVGALLTQSPVVSPDDLEALEREIASIAPLGDFALPGHVFPTSHVEFGMRLPAGEQVARDVFAPARIRITRVLRDTRRANDAESPLPPDYQLDFSVCEDVSGYFTQLPSLSDDLQKHLRIDDEDSWHCSDALANEAGASRQSCSKSVRGPTLEAGSRLGTAGASLGFGLLDSRTANTVANPRRWPPSERTSVCPFDYFEEGSALQNVLYDKLGSEGMPRERPPACGTAYWDEPDTARGVWFVPGLPERPEDPHITLAYYNMDGQSGVFALGSSVHEASAKFGWLAALGEGEPDYVGNRVYLFTAGTSEDRTINRPFEDITSGDPMIHCYEHLRDQSSGHELDAVILLALDSRNQLTLEVVPGRRACAPRNERRFGDSVLRYER